MGTFGHTTIDFLFLNGCSVSAGRYSITFFFFEFFSHDDHQLFSFPRRTTLVYTNGGRRCQTRSTLFKLLESCCIFHVLKKACQCLNGLGKLKGIFTLLPPMAPVTWRPSLGSGGKAMFTNCSCPCAAYVNFLKVCSPERLLCTFHGEIFRSSALFLFPLQHSCTYPFPPQ